MRAFLDRPAVKGALGALAVLVTAGALWLVYVHLTQHAAMWAWINQREAERQSLQRAQTPPALPTAGGS